MLDMTRQVLRPFRSLIVLPLAILLLAAGMIFAQASTNIKFEAESGVLSGQVSRSSDALASAGQSLYFGSIQSSLYTPIPGCIGGSRSIRGQANPSAEAEPQGSIWCFNLAAAPAKTRIEGTNHWIDEFDTNVQMHQFEDYDLGYRIFNRAGGRPPLQAKHFLNNNHWMTDSTGAFTGGSSMRPDRSFRFENGKFIIEGDVAAGVPEYEWNGNGEAWVELTITSSPTAPAQSADPISDGLYAYGQFGGHYSIGCRLQGLQNVCAVMGPTETSPPDNNCHGLPGNWRILEISWFQKCGTKHTGGLTNQYWRACETNQMDMHCRDRFRMEVMKDGLKLWVNGHLFFEDSGWPANRHLPDSFLNGPIYAYMSSWDYRADSGDNLFRTHWDHFAVNPKDPTGQPIPPTAAPSFCLGEPKNTCPMVFVAPDKPVPSKDKVDILDFVFATPNITIAKGDTVTWTNRSTNGLSHTVTSTTGAFNSGFMAVNASFSRTFNTAGVYDYYCIPHPAMTGSVTVLP